MNILVLGGGGREHALVAALAQSPHTTKLYAAPGNGGTAALAKNVDNLNDEDGNAVLAFVEAHAIDLVVVGPEAPLVAGVADVLRRAGVAVFGPNAQGAQLEGSKTFSKEFMVAQGIPTAAYGSFSDLESALSYVRKLGAPVVVKADGLAAGKGVVVAENLQDAEDAVRRCFGGAFGKAGSSVVVEEFLSGPECSLLALVSKGQAVCMATAQDHKRAFDGDRGPNTGGMGVYSPVPLVHPDELAAMHNVMKTAAAATARQFEDDYRGVLYGGFMLTSEGPKLLEFNARFGDPETQVILPRLLNDLPTTLMAVAQGRPEDIDLRWSEQQAVCVVLASGGYPGAYEKNKVILGIEEAEALEGVTIYHAGTRYNTDGELVTSGGRVLDVVALGNTFDEARKRAYEACDLINFEGKQYRLDIGCRASAGRVSED